jgi:26S proteasome regulatory subunit N6
MNLLRESNALFSSLPKSRTAKIVRSIIDTVGKVPDSTDIEVELCRDVVEWCKNEKRTFLRQRVEARVSQLYIYSYEIT